MLERRLSSRGGSPSSSRSARSSRGRDHGRRPRARPATLPWTRSARSSRPRSRARARSRHADLGDAVPLHRPRAAVAFRMGSSTSAVRASSSWARSSARGSPSRSAIPCVAVGALRRRDEHRGRRLGAALGADPGRAAGVLLDQRDHHLADAQLRRRAADDVPDLRLSVVLARHLDARGGSSRRASHAGGGRLAALGSPGRRSRSASCSASPRSRSVVVPLRAHAVRLRGRRSSADSPRAARYAGMRTRRKILAVMALSGAIAGIGGASQIGRLPPRSTPNGLQAAGTATRASWSRRSPATTRSRSCSSRSCIGGLQNAGHALQGADFPSGLVGVMEGLILFCALGGELLVRYRLRAPRRAPRAGRGGASRA